MNSIQYISVFDRCIDIQYTNNKVDTLHFSNDSQRDMAVGVVEECFGKEKQKASLVKDYPFVD